MTPVRSRDVVVTSAAVLTSVADTLTGFADALRDGRSGVGRGHVPGFGTAQVAALDLEAGPTSGPLADPGRRRRMRGATARCAAPARLSARVGWEAVIAAGLDTGQLSRSAVIVGGNNLAMRYQSEALARFAGGEGTVLPSHALAYLDVDAVGAASELTGVTAEGCAIGGSSASGTLAIIHAARLLALDAVDHCLVVGALSELSAAEYRALTDVGAMAAASELPPPAVCRPFDRGRSGFVHGHGTAALVLERRDTARHHGRRPLAALAGHAQRLSGTRGAEPSPERQAETIRAALADAGLDADDIDYVNAHATGSRVGDKAEAEALFRVFGNSRPLVNSTKELTGHCLSAAGVIEAVATLLQLRDGFCHPNPNLADPEDPRLAYVGPKPQARRLRAAVSTSFAFSGINAAIVMTPAEDI
ncbi:MAG TPA: beta-ketoacyl synthase N-terminal-like domain-containing protein [Streptosporangiaceae bacterium]|nr:beta-ketoacyl synthase N-terminal-like domain-containing protein [Streptosporangiaceae bacterium]